MKKIFAIIACMFIAMVSVHAQTADNDELFEVVEQSPVFPGGMKELMNYCKENLKCPECVKKDNITGRVLVSFIVDKSGKVRDAKIIKSLNEDCDNEALRVVKMMPDWTPGKQRGKCVNVRYILPISFKTAAPEEQAPEQEKTEQE